VNDSAVKSALRFEAVTVYSIRRSEENNKRLAAVELPEGLGKDIPVNHFAPLVPDDPDQSG